MNLLFIVALSVFIGSIEAQQPALRVRLTGNGANYLGQVGEQLLAELVTKNSKIPPFEKEDGHATIKFYGGSITSFTSPALRLIPSPPNVLTISTNGGRITAKGSGSCKYRLGFLHPGFHYDLDATASNLQISVSTNLEVANGHLQLGVKQCTANIGGLDLSFGGSIVADIIDLFKGFVEDEIRKVLNDELCKQLQKLITEKANADLAGLTQSFDLFDGFKLNYGFAPPQLTASVIDVLFTGSLQYLTEAPVAIAAPALSASAEVDKYLYFWVAGEIVNSIANMAQQKGLLKYRLGGGGDSSADDCLLTTCDDSSRCSELLPGICIGVPLPQIGQKYPNTSVYMDFNSLQAPVLSIAQGKANLQLVANLDMRVEEPADQPVLNGLLTFGGDVSVKVDTSNPAVTKLTGDFTLTSLVITNVTSDIGDITTEGLQSILDKFVGPVMIGLIRTKLGEGIDIPQIKELKLIGPQVSLAPGFAQIASSVQYTG